MKKNVGNIDRIVRIIVAAIVAALYFTGTVTGTLAIVLAVGAVIFAFTGLTGWCAIYSLVGMNTCKIEEGK